MKILHYASFVVLSLLLPLATASTPAQTTAPSAHAPKPLLSWNFDEKDGDTAHEQMQHADGKISGIYLHVAGAEGEGLRLDGETSGVSVPGASVPLIGPSFTTEAWIAIDAYPWNWAPIVDQRRKDEAGLLFGVDSFGHLGLQAEIDGGWHFIVSSEQLPLKKWVHVAATFSPTVGMTLYIDGKEVRHIQTQGSFTAASGDDLLLGRVRYRMLPAQWIHPKYPVWFSFDGILDNVRVFNEALSAEQIMSEYNAIHPPAGEVLPYPKLPSGAGGEGPFGAYYTTLKYDKLWDMPRRVGPDSDVVVRFDNSPVRLVSWQGTSYIPAWVTGNGKWYTDEFVETGGAVACPGGEDCEPMSDKQNRYAHVRILEDTPARVVIHVRYGQCEVENYTCANPDPLTGWTDWADDYYTIYPDEIAARKTVAWSSNLVRAPEFQETIIINQPGMRPEQDIQVNALTFVNLKGETKTYSWEHPPLIISQPVDANIQVVNLKSVWKPFQIVMPEHPLISIYQGEKTYSMFEWWNHWPVAEVKSSGISAVADDRPSHSSLSHIEGQPYQRTWDSMTKIMLDGLTDRPAADLAMLGRSWATPPVMDVKGADYKGEGYDPTQRAFVVDAQAGAKPLQMSFAATAESPLMDPAVVVQGWGSSVPTLKINGKPVRWGEDARYGLVPNLEKATLVVWLRMQATGATSIEVQPAGK